METTDFYIRTMSEAELDLAIGWAADEGWNPGLNDRTPFYEADRAGFFMGLLNDEPIGCISAVAYDKSFGFIGLYIVRAGFRDKGYGIKLWQHAVNYLGDRNIGLDGVLAQQENYKKSGFKLAYRNIRYEGTGGKFDVPSEVVPLSGVSFDEVLSYDRRLFPAERVNFLKLWITQPGHIALAILDKSRLAGFGVMRPCRVGFKLGPLFADNADLADTLFWALKSFVPGQRVYLDIPEVNPLAVSLAEKHKLTRVFETARMYTKATPEIEIEKLFGITTFELG
ncbi:MAG: GNAT family N-acetyltransferase [Nitrospirae bacterium]|nr:GNAT family N-acetyltransferase [Nitrospirota bacterium]